MTIDGTDFRIREPTNFDKKWYTPKFHGPGVRYEVGIAIQTGWIVWINGPYPCGTPADLTIALDGIVHMFEGDERCVLTKDIADTLSSLTSRGDTLTTKNRGHVRR